MSWFFENASRILSVHDDPAWDPTRFDGLVANFRASRSNASGICDKIHRCLKNGKFDMETLERWSKWCDWNHVASQTAALELSKAVFGVELERLVDEFDDPLPDYEERFDRFVKAFTGPTPLPEPEPSMLSKIVNLCWEFPQVILYGPPGTGKTHLAQRAALALLGEKGADTAKIAALDNGEVGQRLRRAEQEGQFGLVVFHPAYEYEQFIGGIHPSARPDGGLDYDVTPGTFLRLCELAADGRPVVLIVDEINRGNLPKLLGELVYALEYRGHRATLPFAYGEGESRRSWIEVPRKLFVIGTMNSSDRSIGHIDAAIRRRFALVHVPPNKAAVEDSWKRKDLEFGRRLARFMEKLNDDLKGGGANRELLVGHSYFIDAPDRSAEESKRHVADKWRYQVLPLLAEYEAQLPDFDRSRYDDKELNQVIDLTPRDLS